MDNSVEKRLDDALGLPTNCRVCGAKLDTEDRHRGQCYSHGPWAEGDTK
jgi:hypothetical protein